MGCSVILLASSGDVMILASAPIQMALSDVAYPIRSA